MSEPLKNRWSLFVWALLYLLIAGALQLNIPYPWDDDRGFRCLRQPGPEARAGLAVNAPHEPAGAD